MAGPVATTTGSPAKAEAAGVCPDYRAAVELIGKRWTGAIVQVLMPSPLRFSELSQSIPEVSDKLLSCRLKELEAEGIVSREVLGGTPVHVQYGLTDKGRALEPSITSLRRWARQWTQ